MEFTFKVDLDTTGIKELKKNANILNKRHIRWGWIDGKRYPSSHPNNGIAIAQVANWQEYGLSRGTGSKDIPARPYFRQAINVAKTQYTGEIAAICKAAVTGAASMPLLNTLADDLVKDYHESVLMQNYTPLSSYTVSLKGHSYQMDDSGYMIMNFKSKVYRQSMNSTKGK